MSYAYNAWSIIFRAVFPYQTSDNIPIFLTFDYIADIIYLFDIALFKVRLQFLHNGFWVEDYKKTKANYFRKRDFKVQTFWEFFNRRCSYQDTLCNQVTNLPLNFKTF
ncbi:cyclic nucleotide-gated cation channel beta-1 [Caerostris darwini]|uniref:Cyclic nucleotide-gated cation channel beta-1 n=1 Tax=Caerostris darwini TaxID=1538125 RepID=A0AAV4RBD0_9ARAC|nr:cyclic nucleotide-gated cation channel beta-1 [Caerostris darwini]